MANISFNRGTQAKLDALTSIIPGAFYLTTDTNRLYVGKAGEDGAANYVADINQYIVVVKDTTELYAKIPNPAAGDFAYIKDLNVLAVCNDPTANVAGNKWQQINVNTDTYVDTYLKEVTQGESSYNEENQTIEVPLHFTIYKANETNVNGGEDKDSSLDFTLAIKANSILNANKVNVGLNTESVTDGATIKLTGDGIDSTDSAITLKAGLNTNLTVDGDTITVSATDSIASLEAVEVNDITKIKLAAGNGAENAVAIKNGNDKIIVSLETAEDADDAIVLTHKEYDVTVTKATPSINPEPNSGFEVVTAISDDKGHITGYTTQEVILPPDLNSEYYLENSDNAEDKQSVVISGGDLTVTLKGRNGGADSSATASGQLYYTLGDSTVKYSNQSALPVYTTAQIDELLKGVNAMVYKGTLNSGIADGNGNVSNLPVTGVKIGDTYKVALAGDYGDGVNKTYYSLGDLVIAMGEEDEEGEITAASLHWTVVPSGDDTDTRHELKLTGETLVLSNTTDGNLDEITFAAGNSYIEVSGEDQTLSIAHKVFDTVADVEEESTSLYYSDNITYIDSITEDNGHITGYHVAKATLPGVNLSSISVKAPLANETANAKIAVSETQGQVTEIGLEQGQDIVIAGDTEKGVINIAHAEYLSTAPEAEKVTVANGETLTIVESITPVNGHISAMALKEVTLDIDVPNDHYEIRGEVSDIDNGVLMTSGLHINSSDVSNSSIGVNFVSDSLTITSVVEEGNNPAIQIGLVWNEF